jgi:hypothetical protein
MGASVRIPEKASKFTLWVKEAERFHPIESMTGSSITVTTVMGSFQAILLRHWKTRKLFSSVN